MSPILSNGRKNERGIYRNNPRRKYNKILMLVIFISGKYVLFSLLSLNFTLCLIKTYYLSTRVLDYVKFNELHYLVAITKVCSIEHKQHY